MPHNSGVRRATAAATLDGPSETDLVISGKLKESPRIQAAIRSFSQKERVRIDSLLNSCGVVPAEHDSYLADLLGLMEVVLDRDRP